MKRNALIVWTMICAAATAALVSHSAIAGPTTRCPKESLGQLYGWYHNTAHVALGSGHAPSKETSTIYVARTVDNKLYLHSNYVPAGDKNPIKVLTDETTNLAVLTEFLLDAKVSSPPRAVGQGIKYVLDSSLFDADGTLLVDARWLRKARVLNGRNGGAVNARRIGSAKDYFAPWVVDYAPHISSKVGISPVALARRLGKLPFDKDRVRVGVLISDLATDDALRTAKLSVSVRLTDPSGTTAAALDSMFEKHKGHTLVLLGHIWESSYVIGSPGAKAGGLLPLKQLDALARKHDVNLLSFGCFSGKAAAVGMENAANSVVVVQSLQSAMTASNWDQFFRLLASSKLPLVIRDDAGLRAPALSAPNLVVDLPTSFGKGSTALLSIAFGSTLVAGDQADDDRDRAPVERVIGWNGLDIGSEQGGGLKAVLYTLLPDDQGARVADVDPEGPSSRAGVRPGDRIVTVDGADATKMPVDEVMTRLNGMPGERRALKLRREDGSIKMVAFELAPRKVQAEEEPAK